MYKNLNQLTQSRFDIKYNNSTQTGLVSNQLNSIVSFTFYDLVENNKKLIINGMSLKNCVIKCPNGQIWNGLDYYIETTAQGEKTIFNFSYVNESQWDKNGTYYIYAGNTNRGVALSNSNDSRGVQLMNINGNDYTLKKLIAGNNIVISYNDKNIRISNSYGTSYSQPKALYGENRIIDAINGDLQIFYTQQEDTSIQDLIDSFIGNNDFDSSQSSESQSSLQNSFHNIINVTIILYKPEQNLITYKNNVILKRYDIGWFAFGIKKIFNSLFIGQPTRIITDYQIN